MTIQEFMTKTYRVKSNGVQSLRPLLECNDGFDMSVQASRTHACTPRMDGNIEYHSVEIGFPSQEEELLIPYAHDKSNLINTIYVWVPVDIVNQVIEKHGGIRE